MAKTHCFSMENNACYAAFEAALQLLLPGKRVEGPISPQGNRPIYKGHVAPSSTDSGSCGNIIMDFYWGMELYPRIGKNFDIKVFTNCRFGMMAWAVLALTYCIKQYDQNGKVADSMFVNTILMLVYVTKFFWWEAGYWNTMDIAHDRAGFYICWGCLVWVPSLYTSPGMYLVNHPVNLGTQLAIYILVAGILCIYINYDCDRQRQVFRRTNGKCTVWGKAPSKIVASYTTSSGETKSSLLLTSGWWGLSRHFHYVPEILAAFFWTVPALFNHFLPYFYVIFLTILLFDRAKRDDDRCRSKYGKYWNCIVRRFPIESFLESTEVQIALNLLGHCKSNQLRLLKNSNGLQFLGFLDYLRIGNDCADSVKQMILCSLVLLSKSISTLNHHSFWYGAEGNTEELTVTGEDVVNDNGKLSEEGNAAPYDDHLTLQRDDT
ncbi:hypothetical protein GH714_001181 [Hevea brasiliensis]|uniref:7-dehydrocholesterol reductase n=1 Tax=Hevea brasiliensis TaxID=3981 RepID=A0A6A6MB56_HEVBR|nr:hypothetical protein GH714_001181 [Hevea brasiliensis]